MNIKQFWKAVLAQDEEEIRKYFHKDAYVNWHCTNEHFTVDEYIIANCEYPGEWDGIIERTEIVNELIITVTQIYPRDKSISFHVTSFIQTKDDKIIARGYNKREILQQSIAHAEIMAIKKACKKLNT